MLVYGKNVAREVLNKNNIVKKVYLKEDFNNEELLNLIEKNNNKVIYKTNEELDKLVNETTQGIVVDIEDYHYKYFEDLKEDDDANFVVILDHIEDPRNFGAIIRTCECAGVDYIVIPNKRSVEITASVFKSSSGAAVHQKICKVANLHNTIEKLKKNGFWIIGTDANGEDYTSINYTGKIALVIGSEGKGLQPLLRKSCDQIASIPLKGKINSLNASVAAGIMIYEIAKTK